MINESVLAVWSPEARGLCNHLWQSTLFSGIIALLALVLRKNQARTRYTLWMTASAKFLIPFSLLVSLGTHLPWHTHAVATNNSPYAAIDQLSRPFSDLTAHNTPIVIEAPSLTHSDAPLPLLWEVLTSVWLIGVAATMAIWVVQWLRISHSVRSAQPALEGRELELLRKLEQKARLATPIPLLLASASMEPGVFGITRPVLLWPKKISTRLTDAHLESVLAHEICHVQRRDNLTSVIHMVVEAIFWFHPMIWWIETQLVKERERACDEQVLLICGKPSVYAESILKVCEFCVESPLTCVSGVTGADLKQRINQIMSDHATHSLTLAKKLLLLTVGLGAVTAPVMLGAVRMMPLFGRMLHTDGKLPAFEVATIKPSKPDQQQYIEMSPGLFKARHISLRKLVKYAYEIKLDDQLIGGPSWMEKEYFDVDAKAGSGDIDSMRALGPFGLTKQSHLMLQSLLEDRFHLKTSHKTEELPAYALVVAKGGPKLHEVAVSPEVASAATPPLPPPPPPPGASGTIPQRSPVAPLPSIRKTAANQITATAFRMAWFADWLLYRDEIGRIVIDRTGLQGNYDFVLDGISAQQSGLSGPTPSSDSTMSIFTAIQDQLGLKLVPTKAAAEVLVIDHVEPSTAN